MAGASLFTLLDDIAALLDDVAVMTKVAAKKTAGVVGDDLALNADSVKGMVAAREWPVVWEVMKGSFLNKLILVPAALLLSAFAAFLIKPLLMLGGAFLCFEGVEKLLHSKKEKSVHLDTPLDANAEREKIRGAILTDFILSAEIVVIVLGTFAAEVGLMQRALVLSVVAIGVTVGVYVLVGAIVKIDDVGLSLSSNRSENVFGEMSRLVGRALVTSAPKLMKTLSVVGTVAMFLVGGEILLHNLPLPFHAPEGTIGMAASLATGLAAGFLVVGLVSGATKLFKRA